MSNTAMLADPDVANDIHLFFSASNTAAQPIYNEHSVQLELGCFFRAKGYAAEFERPFQVAPAPNSSRKPKKELDLLISRGGQRIAVEIKVPLAGRVPETMYDFCADISFLEALLREGFIAQAFALLITNNRQFWHAVADSDGIYRFFRTTGELLRGNIAKPTGDRSTVVALTGTYDLARSWKAAANANLMPNGRYLLVEAHAAL